MKKHLLFFIILLFSSLSSFYTAFPQEELKEPTWVYYGRGNRYFHDKKLGYALSEYKKALKKIDDKMKQSGKTDNYLPDVCMKIAQIYLIEGLYDASLFYLDISQKNSDLFQIPDRIFTVLYLKAKAFYGLNRIDKVIEVYNNIISKDSNWNNYKVLRSNQMPDFIYSEEKKTKFGAAYFNLGKIKYDNANYDNAIVYLRMSFLYRYNLDRSSSLLKKCYKRIGMYYMIKKINKMIKGSS